MLQEPPVSRNAACPNVDLNSCYCYLQSLAVHASLLVICVPLDLDTYLCMYAFVWLTSSLKTVAMYLKHMFRSYKSLIALMNNFDTLKLGD